MNNYLLRLWRGDISFLQTFWIWNVAIWGLLNFINRSVNGYELAFIGFGYFYFFFAIKCLGSSGSKYHSKATGYKKIWFPITVVYIIIQLVGMLGMLPLLI
tara:strand:+ start:478 stop:780 length:303 start_codon:yes stop_codon:yes gene_type:complete